MGRPLTLPDLQAIQPGSSRLLTSAMVGIMLGGLNLPGRRVRFQVEGWEHLPEGPGIWVANHTQFLDWIALRWVGWWRGRHLCNWVKPRTYEEGYRRFLNRTGNVPVVSRGYLIAADFRAAHGRPPDEREYRAMRDHIDSGQALPDEGVFRVIEEQARDILGVRFDPTSESWRACIEGLFHAMMQATLRHTRTLCDQGVDLQIMPQGVTAVRLTKGHPGALQAALALDLPLVPIGVNGFPQAWGARGRMLPAHGGVVTIRVGQPYRADTIDGHVPFMPSSERTHAAALRAGTDAMMARIAALLDPEHGPADSEDEADVQGVDRFV